MANHEQHYEAARRFQAYYDDALSKVGMRAPSPVLGQSVNDYRRETLRTIKRTFLPQNHQFYKMQMRRLPDDVLPGLEPQILQAACDEAVNPAHLEPGELKMIQVYDPQTGRVKWNDWIGQESFVKQMMRPGRRVVSFKTDQGYVDATGRGLR
jgi:hypothetical protein